MTDETLLAAFNRLYGEGGEIVNLTEGDSLLRTEADAARRIAMAYWPRGFAEQIGFDYSCEVYDAFAPNAFADFAEGRHWTGLSTGMIYTLAELSVRLAAVLPVPDPAEPPVALTAALGVGFRFVGADFQGPRAEAAAFFGQAEAFGPLRRRLMNTLWLDAQTLVWRHELFHASLGHTRFLRQTFGAGAVNEGPVWEAPTRDFEYYEICRALEFHADWAAFGSILKLSRSDMDPAGGDLKRRLGLAWRAASMMAAVLMLPAFFRVAETRGAPRALTHPSAAARLTIFLSRIEEIDEPDVRQAWLDGAGLAIGAYRALGREDPQFAAFDAMLTDQAMDEAVLERLTCIDIFDALQEFLIPYAVLPLGHPHQGGIEALPVDDDAEAPDGM